MTRAAAARPTVRAMWPPSVVTANCRRPNAIWHAHWGHEWPHWPIDCRSARESGSNGAHADHLALDRGRLESPRVDDHRLFVAHLHPCSIAAVGAAEWAHTGAAPHLRLGHLVRYPLSRLCVDRTVGQSCGTLGGRHELAARIRLVLRYDFVFACFSSASRMKGMVSRR